MQSGGGTFSDVFSRVAQRGDDRRHYQRRAGAFELRWAAPDEEESRPQVAVGTEISANGLVFISADAIKPNRLDVTFLLAGHLIAAQVRLVRQDRVVLGGRPAHRCACEFCGLLADDWEAIERYANGEEREADRSASAERQKARKASDAYLLLPNSLQRKIVEVLVSEERLEPPEDPEPPRLELYYSGIVENSGEKPMHRLHVHSRKRAPAGELIAYDTRFLVGDDGALHLAR